MGLKTLRTALIVRIVTIAGAICLSSPTHAGLCEIAVTLGVRAAYSVQNIIDSPYARYTGYKGVDRVAFDRSLSEGISSPAVRSLSKQLGISEQEAVQRLQYLKTAPQQFLEYLAVLHRFYYLHKGSTVSPFISTTKTKVVAAGFGRYPIFSGEAYGIFNFGPFINSALYETDVRKFQQVKDSMSSLKKVHGHLLWMKRVKKEFENESNEEFSAAIQKKYSGVDKTLLDWLTQHNWLKEVTGNALAEDVRAREAFFDQLVPHYENRPKWIERLIDLSNEDETVALLNIPPEAIVKATNWVLLRGSTDKKVYLNSSGISLQPQAD